MRQIPLPLHNDSEQNELIITACNQFVFNRISTTDNAIKNKVLLLGDAHSGKNLFGRYFEQSGGGIFAPNAEKLSDEKLFFLWNQAHDERRSLLLSSQIEPSLWSLQLPDLKSRIASMELLRIPPPDDELISELIQQKLRRFGAVISINALAYSLKRIERDYEAINKFIEDCVIIANEHNMLIKIDQIKPLL